MTHLQLRGVVNTLLLQLILLVGTVVQSEIGGPGSIYNSVNVALISLFLVLNQDFDKKLVPFFVAPLAFLLLSVAANVDTLHPGGYRTAMAITIGYAMFALKPLPLHHPLMKTLTGVYLIGAVGLSFGVTLQRHGFDFGLTNGNSNFHINPNSAALFFFQIILLGLAVLPGTLGWAIAVPAMLLMITTWSRAGALCTALTLAAHSIFTHRHTGSDRQSGLVIVGSNWKAWLAVAVAGLLSTRYVPDAVDMLLLRFVDNEGRAEQWERGWSGIQTIEQWLIGGGPATLSARINGTAHNSYIEAIGSAGIFFLAATLIAVYFWLRRLASEGARDVLWIAPPILLYGMVENILFNGIGTLWLLLMILSVTHRSFAARYDVALLSRPRHRIQSQPRLFMNPDLRVGER